MKNKILIIIASISLLFTWGCKDDFADINTDPSVVNDPDIRYLFTQALKDFDPYNYHYWFYQGSQYYFDWAQVSSTTDINMNIMGAVGSVPLYNVMLTTEEIKHLVDVEFAPEESARYQHIKAMCNPLVVYLGLMATDMDGSIAYTEAMKGRYTNPALLTPKYDTQKELFDTWLSELDASIKILTNPVMHDGKEVQQVSLQGQDVVYKGDASKWAKYANSLKLRIAVRLLHQDREKAFKIAQEVVNSPAGILSSVEDDFVYNLGSEQYHFHDAVDRLGYANKSLIDFMVSNKDPRVRLHFRKNSFNSKVIQAFFDTRFEQDSNPDFKGRKADIPPYIREYVETEKNAEGKEVFKGWKAPGEPWVRYYGRPVLITANLEAEYLDYFDSDRFKIKLNGVERSYSPFSSYNEENIRGQIDFTYPDAPGAPVVQDKDDNPWYGVLFTTAEVNLYLAEFSLLGATLPKSAEQYFNDAIRASVTITDKVAGLNRIPYYHEVFDVEFEKSIKLVDGEIDTLLEHEAYQLTGDLNTKLEKVYLQQYIHFINIPNELFVTVRRSGVPKKDSKYLAREVFLKNEAYPIPRRFIKNAVETSDLLYDIKMHAYKEQGFSVGNFDPAILNAERVWYDKGAPNYGEGPNYK